MLADGNHFCTDRFYGDRTVGQVSAEVRQKSVYSEEIEAGDVKIS